MSNQWNHERKREEYYKMAKKQDYRSRASFKLLQLNRKFKIIRKGDSVVDLGAAPGGWSQVALEAVGEDGLVVGVDLNKIRPLPEENFWEVRGDFTQEDTIQEIEKTVQGKAQIILSDASPQHTGIKDLDQIRSIDLAQSVMKICNKILKNNGKLIMKVFQGEGFPELLKDMKKCFRTVKTTKPPSSRKQSGEMYIVARGFIKNLYST
jgi:23S rRNA (uridine2552-2'-O)-methyltransferase